MRKTTSLWIATAVAAVATATTVGLVAPADAESAPQATRPFGCC